ncbi:hypothetical protein ACFPOB_23675 [Bosea eneae]|uniref:Glycosyltransferase 2-like domain-containing protein n=1 Tax=Bosea eneae TaxID=151454 RepID=A0ABW0IW34_9HYPH
MTDGGSTAMTAKETQMRGARACAGVVLYRPDKALLARQAEGLRGLGLFAFANGPVDADTLAALAPTDLHLIESEENVGLGRGLNVVMATAASEGFTHVMLLDQDSEPPRDLLDRLTSRCTALEELERRSPSSPPVSCRRRKASTSRSVMNGAEAGTVATSRPSISHRHQARW